MDASYDLWSAYSLGAVAAATPIVTPQLIGQNIWVIADGVPSSGYACDGAGNFVVPITSTTSMLIGVFYTSECTLLPIEDQVNGSAQGKRRSLTDWYVRVYKTQCLTVNNQDQAFRRMDTNVLDNPVPLTTTIKRDNSLGWTNQGATLTLSRTTPLKQVILSVNRGFEANE